MNRSIQFSGQPAGSDSGKPAGSDNRLKRFALIGAAVALLALGGCAVVPTPYGPAVVPAAPAVVAPGYGYGGPVYGPGYGAVYGPGYGGAVVVRPYGRPYGHRYYR